VKNITKDGLAIYKGSPVKIVNVDKKIDISLANGEKKKVRDKDLIFIHKGPISSLAIPTDLECDIKDTWDLLQGESVSLEELAEFLFGDSSAVSTYNAYLHLENGLYFTGESDSITCTSSEFVSEKIEKEQAKNAKAKEYKESIDRLEKSTWCDKDEIILRDIETLAYEQKESSKVLKGLGIKETPVDAHRFLIKIGYWKPEHNPYPGRMGVSLKSTIKQDEYVESHNPLDLTYLKSYAIDDEGSKDPDDAISMDGDNKVWIHITDVASIIIPGSNGDLDASAKGSNLYLPTGTVHMLPKELTALQGLGIRDVNNTLSFMVEFDSDFNIIKREIHLAKVSVKRTTYSTVEDQRESDEFAPFYKIAHILRNRRAENGSISISLPEVKIHVDETGDINIKPIGGVESRNVVSEFMLLAGESAALFASEHNIAIPYVTQQPPDAKGAPETDLASMFVWRRKFKRGEIKYSPEPHAGLGLECYTRATSPLRRYSDLVVNQQIRAFLLGEPTLNEEDILLKVAPSIESMRTLTQCERASNQHWKMVYLSSRKDEKFQATFVEKKDKGLGIFLIEDLALECSLNLKTELELNSKIFVKVKKIDIPTGIITFSQC